jgi:hypothetical protein
VDYNRSIMNVHYRKGSLLDYDGVYLAEGEWPAKAYFDAMRQARKRDAGLYMDYGYTRPNVVSQGPMQQGCSPGCESNGPQPTEGPSMPPEQVAPEGNVPMESLPAPGATTPPAETSTSTWREADEKQASYSTRPAADDAAGWTRSEMGWTGENVWRRQADDLSGSRNAYAWRVCLSSLTPERSAIPYKTDNLGLPAI